MDTDFVKKKARIAPSSKKPNTTTFKESLGFL